MQIRRFLLKISCVLMVLVSLSACDRVNRQSIYDFLRTLAGRPTSHEIAVKGAAIENIKEMKALEAIRAHIADSLAAIENREQFLRDSLQEAGVLSPLNNEIEWSSDTQMDSLAKRYYIMIGVFSVEGNALSQMKMAEDAGYSAVHLKYTNGNHAIAIAGADRVMDICSVLDSVRTESFCPGSAWIFAAN